MKKTNWKDLIDGWEYLVAIIIVLVLTIGAITCLQYWVDSKERSVSTTKERRS
jgi:hypothetical protein